MKEYKFHEYSYLFPLIEGKEFEELKEDIKEIQIAIDLANHEQSKITWWSK